MKDSRDLQDLLMNRAVNRATDTGKRLEAHIQKRAGGWKLIFRNGPVAGNSYSETGRWLETYIQILESDWKLTLI